MYSNKQLFEPLMFLSCHFSSWEYVPDFSELKDVKNNYNAKQ